MIKKFILCVSIFSLFTVGLLAQEKNLPVETIVEKYIAACGGAETLKQIRILKLTGNYVYRGLEYPLTIFKARPQLFRVEISGNNRMQVNIFDGEAARSLDAQTGQTKAIRDARVQHFIEMMADFDGALVDYKIKGHQVSLVGTELVEGQPAHVLEVALREGPKELWFIDAESFILVKRTSPFIYDNREATQSLYFMDYKSIDGFMVPHYIERNFNHYVYSYEIDQVEINPKINVDQFGVKE